MAIEYRFQDSNGDTYIPVADGDYYTPNFDQGGNMCDVYIEFYAANKTTLVTPSAGTIAVAGRPLGSNWLAAMNSPINATGVSVGTSTYTPASIDGLCRQARITLNGVTGANFMRAVAYQR